MKNPQFLDNQAETLATLPIHEIVILTKFQKNWTKIVDFSLIVNFKASLIFFSSVFRTKVTTKHDSITRNPSKRKSRNNIEASVASSDFEKKIKTVSQQNLLAQKPQL